MVKRWLVTVGILPEFKCHACFIIAIFCGEEITELCAELNQAIRQSGNQAGKLRRNEVKIEWGVNKFE